MRCPSCAAANAAGARFCAACGTGLTAACPHCSAEVLLGQRFCGNCGALIADEPAAVEAGDRAEEAAAERRLVSVLFVDLEGFTPLAEQLDVEDVRSLQNEYFDLARGVVERYGGVVEKFIGDAVMAVWGAPRAREDDAVRAVRAGRDIVRAVPDVSGGRLQLAARAAVATGEAAVSLLADGRGMLSGDLVNTAARLQAAAPSGGVLVDAATRRAAGGALEFEPIGLQALKGKREQIGVWRATRLLEAPSGRAAGHPGPFVGREAELGELKDLFARTVERRRCRLVSALGIAGIGKSRLAWEFERYLESLAQPPIVLHGRALSYGEGVTFAPLADMLRRYAALPAEGSDRDVQAQVGEALRRLVTEQREREWLTPRLAALLQPSDTRYERDELFAAWRRFFGLLCASAPTVLVFEDVQWADTVLLDFIEYLATWSRDQPLLIVTLARPELLDQRPGWGVGQAAFTALQLSRLSDEAMTVLLRALAPQLQESTIATVMERAGGVPLYGVEVARTLAGSRDVQSEQIPEGLHSLVAARVDALPSAPRRLLLTAAVLGSRFEPHTLAVLRGVPPASIREPLELLLRRELLKLDGGHAKLAEERLSFVQDVVRDVAYRILSRRQRRALHLAAAAHLSEEHVDAVEQLAEHLLKAHAAAPDDPDAPLLAERALAALRRAADRSTAVHAPGQALAYLERALALAQDASRQNELWAEAAQAARSAGRFELAEQYLRRLLEWQIQHGQLEQAARARANLASLLLATERHDTALADLERALRSIPDLDDDPGGLEQAAQLARGRVLVGQEEVGLRWAERTLAAGHRLGLAAVELDALITRGTARVRLGRRAAGLRDLQAAIEKAAAQALPGSELRARNNLAWLTVLDDPHRALATARAGVELATEMGMADMWIQLSLVAARVAMDTGEWDYALDVIEVARTRPQAPAHRIQFLSLEASLRALRGEPAAPPPVDEGSPEALVDGQILADRDMARAWIAFVARDHRAAQTLAARAAGEFLGADLLSALALAARAAAWARDADALASAAAELAELRLHGPVAAATVLTATAAGRALAGDSTARRDYAGAIARWHKLRLPLHLGLCLAERDLLLGGPQDDARAVFRDLSADGLLRLLD
ncbi:MAG TPA: AAA family ATPase [Candidatus Limnocylindria bacterium]|nr:AAA family ATPase [Candidatus Limnocylindria bacterium]